MHSKDHFSVIREATRKWFSNFHTLQKVCCPALGICFFFNTFILTNSESDLFISTVEHCKTLTLPGHQLIRFLLFQIGRTSIGSSSQTHSCCVACAFNVKMSFCAKLKPPFHLFLRPLILGRLLILVLQFLQLQNGDDDN